MLATEAGYVYAWKWRSGSLPVRLNERLASSPSSSHDVQLDGDVYWQPSANELVKRRTSDGEEVERYDFGPICRDSMNHAQVYGTKALVSCRSSSLIFEYDLEADAVDWRLGAGLCGTQLVFNLRHFNVRYLSISNGFGDGGCLTLENSTRDDREPPRFLGVGTEVAREHEPLGAGAGPPGSLF